MNTPNNAAALTYMGRQLTAQEAVTMFANQDATIRSLRDELATLRATLTQPDALTSQPSGEAVDTGNYIHDPLYEALDELYGRGWTDRYKGRDYDPRGTNEWQAVLDLFRKYRTHPSADAPGVAVTDEMIERALEAYHDVYDAEYLANGLMRDNNDNAMRAALSAALAPKPEGGHS